MKKILIIMAGDFQHNSGIENYNKMLLNIMNENYSNFEVDIMLTGCEKIPAKLNIPHTKITYYRITNVDNHSLILTKAISWLKDVHYCRTQFNKNFSKYDLILDSSRIGFPKAKFLKNYYLIQHFDVREFYLASFIKNNANGFFQKIYRKFIKTYNFLKYTNNFVAFDEITKDFIYHYGYNGNVFVISLPSKIKPIDIENISNPKNGRIIFLGRLAPQKKILDLIKINKEIKLIDFYGQPIGRIGEEYKRMLEKDGWYKGEIKNTKDLIKIIREYKFMILYSNFEGFPFSLVESLSQGVPIIVKDSFLSASYLCRKNTGLLLPNKNDVVSDISLIREFIKINNSKYHQLEINCLEFYNSNLSMKSFIANWIKIFNQFIN